MKHLLFFLLIGFSGSAQHITSTYIDEFTKQNIIQVNASKTPKWKGSDNITKGLFNYVFLSLKKIDSTKILQLDIQTGFNLCINNNDDKIILLLNNENTIELKQAAKLDCANRVLAKYIISDEEIKTLSINPIKKFRIYTYDGYIDFEVKEDKKDIIKNSFSLFNSKI